MKNYKKNKKNWHAMGHFSGILVDFMISNCLRRHFPIAYPARQQMATQTYSNCHLLTNKSSIHLKAMKKKGTDYANIWRLNSQQLFNFSN